MQFLQDAKFKIFISDRQAGDVRGVALNSDGPRHFHSPGKKFRLDWNHISDSLSPQLRRLSAGDCWLDRLELRLRASDLGVSSISVHKDIPIGTAYRLFQHGYQSWSLSAGRQARQTDVHARLDWKHDMDENPETPHQGVGPDWLPLRMFPARGRFHSDGLVGLEEVRDLDDIRGGEHGSDTSEIYPRRILFSQIGQGQQSLRFRLRFDPQKGYLKEFTVIWDFNGRLLPGNGRVSLTPLGWFLENIEQPGSAAGRRRHKRRAFGHFLDDHLKIISRNFKTRGRNRNGLIGWCSWYYYYTKIDEDVIRRNLRDIKVRKLDLDLFQIDDGYQSAIGDWLETNQKFPAGMSGLARDIKAEGYMAGIWLAPFLVEKRAELMRAHPEIILRQIKSDKPVKAIYNPNWGGGGHMPWILPIRVLRNGCQILSVLL